MNKNTIISLVGRLAAVVSIIIAITFEKVRKLSIVASMVGLDVDTMSIALKIVLLVAPLAFMILSFMKNKDVANLFGILASGLQLFIANRVAVNFLSLIWRREAGMKTAWTFYVIFAVVELVASIAGMVYRAVSSRKKTTFAQPVVQPVAQPVAQPVVQAMPQPAPAPVAPAPRPSTAYPLPTVAPQALPMQYRVPQSVAHSV